MDRYFFIAINDLPECITSSVMLFADNCLVYRTIHRTNDVIQLQEDLDQLGLCVNAWQMTLNPQKCSIQHISNKRNTVSTKYTINGIPMNCVSGFKYFDISISSMMSWSDNIDDICAKARTSYGFIRRNLRNSVYIDLTVSLITVHMCMAWPCYCYVDGLS